MGNSKDLNVTDTSEKEVDQAAIGSNYSVEYLRFLTS